MNDPKNTPINKVSPNGPQNGSSTPFKGKDGSPYSRVSSPGAARLSRKQLLELEPVLTDLDWRILAMIRRCRVIMGRQLGRLYFASRSSESAKVTAVNRELRRLVDMGLITSMNQKIDCRLKGYIAYIYYLTEAGERILQIHLGEPETRRRNIEPSAMTLAHTLSVVECRVQTVEACRADDMKLLEVKLEPDCWHPYQYHLKDYILKPDLSLVTEKQDWMDHDEPVIEYRWFIEVDLNTENIQTILEKCRRYYDYYRSDTEQRMHGDVFPLVVWIVKTESRRESIVKYIRETFPKYPRIFAVILPDEYTKLIRDEFDMEDCLCPM